MKKSFYKKECESAVEGIEEMMKGLRPVLESPDFRGVIVAVGVQMKDEGFTRFMFGGNIWKSTVTRFAESVLGMMKKLKQHGDGGKRKEESFPAPGSTLIH
ncbi:MAG: hypothetical protein LBP61_01605 [Desulfovibrio sp.]|nr:hypothetical protein [Desulfovibrio sp.]